MTAHVQVFACWDKEEIKKRDYFFLCSHLHLFHLSLYLACQASLHPLALHPPVLSSYHPSLLAISLSFSDFFFGWNLKKHTAHLPFLVPSPIVSVLPQPASSLFCIQMYLPHSQHTAARQRNTETLIYFFLNLFFMQNREGRSPRSIFSPVKITQRCGMSTNK